MKIFIVNKMITFFNQLNYKIKFLLDKNQKRRVIKNITSKSGLTMFAMVSQIIFPPLMIMTWGLNNFGTWVFLIAIMQGATIFNINISGPVTNRMSILYNQKKLKDLNIIYSNFFIIIIFNIITYTILFLFFTSISKLDFKIFESINLYELKLSFLILFISFVLNIYNNIFITKINYTGKSYLSDNLTTGYDLITKFFLVISGIFYNQFFLLTLIFLIVNLLKTITFVFISKKFTAVIKIKYFTIKKLSKIINESMGNIVETISHTIKNNFQIILLGFFLNAPIVAIISTYKTLFYFMPIRLLDVISSTANYEIIRFYTKKQFTKLRYNLINLLNLNFILSIIIFVFAISLGPLFYQYWIKEVNDPNVLLILFLITDSIFVNLSNTIILIEKSLNKYFKISLIMLINYSISIILGYFILLQSFNYINLFIVNTIVSIIIFFIFLLFSKEFKKIIKKIP